MMHIIIVIQTHKKVYTAYVTVRVSRFVLNSNAMIGFVFLTEPTGIKMANGKNSAFVYWLDIILLASRFPNVVYSY